MRERQENVIVTHTGVSLNLVPTQRRKERRRGQTEGRGRTKGVERGERELQEGVGNRRDGKGSGRKGVREC